jgi:Domain of unknown function (DUF222)
MQRVVAEALKAPSGLDDADRIDAIRAFEELVCTATAAQAQLTAELDASVRPARAATGVRRTEQGRGVAAQVAHPRKVSPHRGERHLGLAKVVRTELPRTWTAWRSSRIPEWTATVIARETACLPLAHLLAVDEVVAATRTASRRSASESSSGCCWRRPPGSIPPRSSPAAAGPSPSAASPCVRRPTR